MLKEIVHTELVKALKAKDETRLSTMRMLLSALNYSRIDKMRDLTEAEELDVVRKEAKKRNDAIEMYDKAEATDRANKEKAELKILEEFLPKAIQSDELSSFVMSSISEVGKDFGAIMKSVIAKTKGAADGRMVSEMVKKALE